MKLKNTISNDHGKFVIFRANKRQGFIAKFFSAREGIEIHWTISQTEAEELMRILDHLLESVDDKTHKFSIMKVRRYVKGMAIAQLTGTTGEIECLRFGSNKEICVQITYDDDVYISIFFTLPEAEELKQDLNDYFLS